MRYPDPNQDREITGMESQTKRYKKWVLWAAFLAVLVWINLYFFSNFNANQVGTLGALGDFFGGMLNPFFAFMAFVLLTQSIRLQLKEMAETRKALQETSAETKRAAEAQEQSVRAQRSLAKLQRENHEIQNNILVLQKEMLDFDRESQMIKIFERSFYNLLEDLKVINEDKKFDFYVPYEEGFNEEGEHFEAGSTKYSLGFEQSIGYLLVLFKKDDFFQGEFLNFTAGVRQSFRERFHRICDENNTNFFLAMDTIVYTVYQMIVMVDESKFLSEDLKFFYISILKKSLKSKYKVWIFLHNINSFGFNLRLYDRYSLFGGMQVTPEENDLLVRLRGFYKESVSE